MLAILGSLLMVVFIIPSTFRGGSGARGGETVVGTVGNVKVHAADEAQAKEDLRELGQAGFRAAAVALAGPTRGARTRGGRGWSSSSSWRSRCFTCWCCRRRRTTASASRMCRSMTR